MFYMRTYLKIEGGKRQGEKPKIEFWVQAPTSLKSKDGRRDRPLNHNRF